MSRRNKESRVERQARWEAESKSWQKSGLADGNMIEVGTAIRGLRGHHAHTVHWTANADAFFRDDEDEEPQSVRLFMFMPADADESAVGVRIETTEGGGDTP